MRSILFLHIQTPYCLEEAASDRYRGDRGFPKIEQG